MFFSVTHKHTKSGEIARALEAVLHFWVLEMELGNSNYDSLKAIWRRAMARLMRCRWINNSLKTLETGRQLETLQPLVSGISPVTDPEKSSPLAFRPRTWWSVQGENGAHGAIKLIVAVVYVFLTTCYKWGYLMKCSFPFMLLPWHSVVKGKQSDMQ